MVCIYFVHCLSMAKPVMDRTSLLFTGARLVSGGYFGQGQGSVRSFTRECSTAKSCVHEARDLPVGECSHDRDVGVFCLTEGKLVWSDLTRLWANWCDCLLWILAR